jgi:hypothetical protein
MIGKKYILKQIELFHCYAVTDTYVSFTIYYFSNNIVLHSFLFSYFLHDLKSAYRIIKCIL